MVKGLYSSHYEHDACGVGMVVNIHGNKSHELVDNALKALENMRGRGADAFVLGCTELPIAFEDYELDFPTVDPTKVLAKNAVIAAGYELRPGK